MTRGLTRPDKRMLPFHMRNPVIEGLILLGRPIAALEQAHIRINVLQNVAPAGIRHVLELDQRLTSTEAGPYWLCLPPQNSKDRWPRPCRLIWEAEVRRTVHDERLLI